MGESEKAQRWHHRAQQLRAIAAELDDVEAKETLIELAKSWSRMAGRLEAQARHARSSAERRT